MQDLKSVEDFFINLLQNDVSPLPIDPFPNVNEIESYKENINSAIGAVVIAINRFASADAHEGGGDFIIYPRFLIFKKDLRSSGAHVGVYDVIKVIVDKIHEKRFKINNEPMKCIVIDGGFLEQSDDLFCYSVDAALVPKLSKLT